MGSAAVSATLPAHLGLSVASSLDAPPELIPVLPELLAGIQALGSTPRRVAAMLGRAGIGPGSRVVELACGKGAVAVEVARRLGCEVLGVDAFAPFLDDAAAMSARRGVAHLTRWRCADARDFTAWRGRWDAALMIGLDGFERAAPVLRRLVRPGGVYVIDDAPRATGFEEPAGVPTRAAARALFRSAGDTIVEEAVPARAAIERLNARLYAELRANAARVRRARPDLATPLREFLRRQRQANALLRGPLRPVVWVVRRGRAAGAPPASRNSTRTL